MEAKRRTKRLSLHVAPPKACQGACGSCNTPRGARCGPPPPPPPVWPVQRRPRPVAVAEAGSYEWQGVHGDLENGVYAGSYGWDNAAYWGIAEKKAGVDLTEWYKTRTEDEFYLPEFQELVDHPETKEEWGHIATFDPMGMYSHPPTISACKAHLDIPELKETLVRDGTIVAENGEVTSAKCAIYYAWNLPKLAGRLDLSEDELREALHKYSKDERLLDPHVRTYIPAVGGCTIYTFGDARKLRDPNTEVAVRVHDECIGSDVFGSDICSCRPYLIFALKQCIEVAQRGGVGVVVYYRKEGRSLGEVIKFRVYNARINQKGGDRADKYFEQTESIAGIRDARFQTMMPDALNWMGIRRIDWLCSMSNEKYEAIVGAGIKVMQRVSLPEDYVKDSMRVELDAKIASGYHSGTTAGDGVSTDLMQPAAVRMQCGRMYELAKKDGLTYFTLNESRLPAAVDAVEQTIRQHYPALDIKPHSRIGHLGGREGITKLLASWACDEKEKARRLVDLVTVSVLLDAGAGPSWKFVTSAGETTASSEGLGHASLELFLDGLFSSDGALKARANSLQLRNLTAEQLGRGMQVSKANPLVGLDGRVQLLNELGIALDASPEFFGKEVPRPGHMVDYLLARSTSGRVNLDDLWKCCIDGLHSMWPMQPNGVLSGDMWMYPKLQVAGKPNSDIVPFHKLTQWLVYSLVDALELSLGLQVSGTEQLTCLAEYRNGGLLVDAGVLELRDPQWRAQEVNVGTELVVEWRAMTVVLVDRIADELRRRLGKTAAELPLAQVLEGGTWRAGRELARQQRQDGSPPIRIRSEGNVF